MSEARNGVVHATNIKSLSGKNAKQYLSSREQDQLKAELLRETRKAVASAKKVPHNPNPKDQLPNDAAGFVAALVLGHDL